MAHLSRPFIFGIQTRFVAFSAVPFRRFQAAMPRLFSSYIVTPPELNEALRNPEEGRIVPLCAAWFMPNDPEKRTGLGVFKQQRIPGSRFFDLDEIKDPDSPYPHMLPTQEMFEEGMASLGIRRDDKVVVYDAAETGLFSAPRAGWMLKVFGHPKVHLLNNFKFWVEDGYPVESGEPPVVEKSTYSVSNFSPGLVVKFAEMKEIARSNLQEGTEKTQLLDARPEGRWAGTSPEPRPGLPSGHMPGSISIPFPELLDPNTKTLLPAEKLREVFKAKGVDPEKPAISSCGTGVTAAIIETALEETNYVPRERRQLYDGSWT